MNRTVREIARELGTNKNVIYRIIEKQNLEPVPTISEKETKRFSDESFQIIKERYSALKEWHGEAKTESKPVSSDASALVQTLQRQIDRYEKEIDRLNATIEKKDELIKELTDNNHAQTIRYQELIAREQTTMLLTAQSQTRFNLFKPSTWKKNKAAQTPDLEPLTPDEQ
jgi:TolA-binding protein